jgi:hypothetical protein
MTNPRPSPAGRLPENRRTFLATGVGLNRLVLVDEQAAPEMTNTAA